MKQKPVKKKVTKLPAKKNSIKPVYKIVLVIIITAFLALLLIPNFFDKNENREHIFKKEGELTITDSLGNSKVKLNIEIADDDYDRQLGLMFRTKMNEGQGMLFIFPQEEIQSFWMKNTLIPLDIIFINADKKIVTIQKGAVPLSEVSLPSSKPSLYVLEVKSGFSDKHNIREGDRINF